MAIRLRIRRTIAREETPAEGEEAPSLTDPTMSHRRDFIKVLGVAAGMAGLAAAGQLAYAPKKAEAYDYAGNLTVAGNLGIGTEGPARKVEVVGGGIAMANGDFTVGKGIRFRQTTDNSGSEPAGGGIYQSPSDNNLMIEAGSATNTIAFKSGGIIPAAFMGAALVTIPGFVIQPYATDTTSTLQIRTFGGQPYVNFDGVNQRVGIGTTSPGANLHIVGTGTEILYLDTYGNDATGPRIRLRKARGTLSSPAAVQDGDELGYYLFRGYDGSAFDNAAWMGAFVDGTPGIGSMPARLIFSTTPSGSAASVERMRIDSQGKVGIGTPIPSLMLTILTTAGNDGLRILGSNSQNVQLYTNLGSGAYNGMSVPGDRGIIYSGASVDNPGGGFVIAPWRTGTSGVRLDALGNVGIGIPNPAAKLDVAGDIFVNGMAAIGADAVARQCYYAQ